MTFPFAGIIFDMDGTLVESESVWEVAETELFAARGITYTDEARQQVIGLRLDEFFIKLKEIYGLDESVESLTEDLIERMLAIVPERVKPKPGAQELIDYADSLSVPYCIASSSPLALIHAIVESQGWGGRITARFSADEVERGKPAPDVYLYAAEKLGIPSARSLAIEDSPNGARSAVAAGMTCYVVPDFHSSPHQFREITPYVFNDLHAVRVQLQTDTQ